MDQQQQHQQALNKPPAPSPAVAVSTPTTTEPPPPQLQPQPSLPPQPPSPSLQPTVLSSSSPSPSPSPNPNPSPTPKVSLSPPPAPAVQAPQQQKLPRPSGSAASAPISRPWLPPYSSPSSSSPLASSSASPSISVPPRGNISIGMPAPHSASSSSPSLSQPSPFSGSFGHQFGGVSGSTASQVRPPIQGMQAVGMGGTLGSSSQVRPGGISAHHPQRPVQTLLRPPSSPASQSAATHNFQGHSLTRVPAVGSSGSPAPIASQSMQAHGQPWLSSGSQGKPPLPPPSFRPQISSPSLQQRSHISQQHHSSPTASQQQQVSSPQPQQSPSHPQQDHYGQQIPQSRIPQSLTHQQQISRPQGAVNQKPSALAMVHQNAVQTGMPSRASSLENEEFSNRILGKRSIHELVNQIDPSEKLDPEVEDILVDIAEDFVDSITTFGCSLAKHRKSETLEAKDILLHLERNWNISLPGFTGDEIKTYRKPLASDIHKERLAVIKRSMLATEATNARSSGGQAAATKGNLGKMPMNVLGSPNLKIREVT